MALAFDPNFPFLRAPATIGTEHFRELAPHLFWDNVLITPWRECIRDPSKQPVPKTDMEKIYFNNNQDSRRAFLHVLLAIAQDVIVDEILFKEAFGRIHTVHLLGDSGTSVYIMPDQQLKIGASSPQESAGQYDPRFPCDDRIRRIFKKFQLTLDKTLTEGMSNMAVIQFAGGVYFEDLGGPGNIFPYGSNSLHMNITNGLLRLFGFEGVPHDWYDVEVLGGRNREQFYEKFTTDVLAANPNVYIYGEWIPASREVNDYDAKNCPSPVAYRLSNS